MTEVTNERGDLIHFEAAAELMDDDLREDLHMTIVPCSEQEFYDAYCEAHYRKYGHTFVCNTSGW